MWYDLTEEPLKICISEVRISQAKAAGAQIIATACPYCKITLSSASNISEIAIKDLSEILLESIDVSTASAL